MNDDNASKFTCTKCGGHELIVTHVWDIQAGNDSESRPDPKYVDAWQQRGWLRTNAA